MVVAIFLMVIFAAGSAHAQQTAFTYQGELTEGGVPVSSEGARMAFRLWDAQTGGGQVGADYIAYPVEIEDGVFTAMVDFGDGPFDGTSLWLEIGVDVDGGTNYTWMTPRQPLTSAPMAVYAEHGGDNPWGMSLGNIWFTSGLVGAGTSLPESQLHVRATGEEAALRVDSYDNGNSVGTAIQAEVEVADGIGVSGKASAGSGPGIGVLGQATSSEGIGVRGYAGATTGTPTGVKGQVRYAGGAGVHGYNSASAGPGVGVFGESNSATGWGGYFLGRGYFSGRVGIGTTSPASELDVAGTVRTDGFTLDASPQDGYVLTSDASGVASWQPPAAGSGFWNGGTGGTIYYNDGHVGIGTTSPDTELEVVGTVKMTGLQLADTPQAGYVLTSDASGNGSWQAPTGGLSLPYEGSAYTSSAAFRVRNTYGGSGGHAIRGDLTSATSTAAAGYFYANGTNGYGVKAYADGADAIYARQNGTADYALHASTLGGLAAGYFFAGPNAGSAAEFEYQPASGTAVKIQAMGATAQGIEVSMTGAESYAARFEAPWVGLVAKGGMAGARIYGDVDIYEYGTSNRVIELGKGLDYAEGFDVTGGKGAACPGCVLVIDPQSPGKLKLATEAYDTKVAGIVAGANGLGSGVRLGTDRFDHDVALAGRVYCNVIAADEDIEPGDMITTSNVPGYAMEVIDHARAQGAVLGKAMEPLAQGERGQILVLVTLQ